MAQPSGRQYDVHPLRVKRQTVSRLVDSWVSSLKWIGAEFMRRYNLHSMAAEPCSLALPSTSKQQQNAYLILLVLFLQSTHLAFSVPLNEPTVETRVKQEDVRRNFIRDMMKHAWHGYAKYAWGHNEVRPESKLPHESGVFGSAKLGATIVDAIDTLYIMGLHDEYLAARSWIESNLNFDQFHVDLSVFETNIRYVGGLLSIYSLTQDPMFLNKSVQIADKLLPAFNTPSGIPHSYVNLVTGNSFNQAWAGKSSVLSEFGAIHLEFVYLSFVTGDSKYQEKAAKIRQTIRNAVPRSDGLYNSFIDLDHGQWESGRTHVSVGAMGDSFYEYLIKAYVQSDGHDVEAYQMYMDAMAAIENKLMFTSAKSRLLYIASIKGGSIVHEMDMLACFSGGMLALGAIKSAEPIRSLHMSFASEITNTCHESCSRTKSKIGPELFTFTRQEDAVPANHITSYYLLRPEIIESYFYLWRYTHDPKYRDWAWDFAEALEKHCKSEAGYSGLKNINSPTAKDDVQQSFFLAETLKYLYLIFSDDSVINLDKWVLNTEAHPIPIIKHYIG